MKKRWAEVVVRVLNLLEDAQILILSLLVTVALSDISPNLPLFSRPGATLLLNVASSKGRHLKSFL